MYRVSGPDLTTLYILLVTVNESTKFYDFIFGACESDGVFFSFLLTLVHQRALQSWVLYLHNCSFAVYSLFFIYLTIKQCMDLKFYGK